MKVNLSLDKKYNAVIDLDKCINCGKCSEYCNMGAIEEIVRWGDEPCEFHCPFGINPQTVAALVKSGQLTEARAYLKAKSNLSHPCSQLCHGVCISRCYRCDVSDKGIDLPALERYLIANAEDSNFIFDKKSTLPAIEKNIVEADYKDKLLECDIISAAAQEERIKPIEGEMERIEDIIPILKSVGIELTEDEVMAAVIIDDENGEDAVSDLSKKIAIAGGGMAGITAAIALQKAGYLPTIFEKTDRLGGVYSNLSTERRIDKDLLAKGMSKVMEMGIPVVYNATVGANPRIDALQEKFDCILFAIGETKGLLPKIRTGLPRGVHDIVTLMDCISRCGKLDVSGQALVFGSDEMTVDAAIELKKHCREVTILSPYSIGVMRILDDGVDIAIAAGVNVVTGMELRGINERAGRVDTVDCLIKEKNYIVNIPCDTLVIGDCQVPDTDIIALKNKALEIDERGFIKVDAKLETSIKGVFALGDLDMSAADAGRAGAIAIDSYLDDEEQAVPVKIKGIKDYPATYEIIEGYKDEDNPFAQHSDEKEVYTRHQAEAEASRCIGCGHRRIDVNKCIGCGICQKQCLGDAIKMVALEEKITEEVE